MKTIDPNKILKKGTVLTSKDGQYHIEDVLGSGGFGITYKASTEIKIGNIPHRVDYAIKEFFIASICTRDANGSVNVNTAQLDRYNSQKKAFHKEAQSLHELPENKGFVRVNEVFEANNTSYYVMQLLHGSLEEFVKDKPENRLAEQEAIQMIASVAEAAGVLHDNRRLHLDIKPDNIMLHDDKSPCLIDFGQSRLYNSKGNLTGNPDNAGSPGYAPKEQYQGIDTFAPSADIYAIGATLLYMLSGTKPCKADEMSREKIDEALPEGISEKTKAVLYKCLSSNPEDRYQNVNDMLIALGVLQSEDEGETVIFGGGNKKESSLQKYWKKGLAAVAVVAILAACVICGMKYLGGNTESDTPTADSTNVDSTAVEKTAVDSVPKSKPTETTPKSVEEPVPTVDNPTPKPVVDNPPVVKPTPEPAPTPTLPYATWSGKWKNGKPDGKGVMKFTKNYTIPGVNISVSAGDMVDGTFHNGEFVQGYVTRSGVKEFIANEN